MKNHILMRLCITLVLVAATGCSSSMSGINNPVGGGGGLARTHEQSIQAEVDDMVFAGVALGFKGIIVADLNSTSAVTSIYGTVERGKTLNKLTDDDMQFLVYGEDGVFAAECEASTLDASYGPTHPLCQLAHAESFDTLIVCFPNSEGADVMVAQNWQSPEHAFDEGHGMICYKDGVKMLSSHIFTY